jgi:hypothetical protein
LLAVLGLGSMLSACSDDSATREAANDGFPRARTCALQVDLGGDVALSLSGDSDDEVGCAANRSGTGFQAIFYPRERGVTAFTLFVEEVGKGTTSMLRPARITLQSSSDIYDADCEAEITVNELWRAEQSSELYRIGGAGRCLGPALGGTPGASVNVGYFFFVTTVGWPKS